MQISISKKAGIVLSVIQLILSAFFVMKLWSMGFLPVKYWLLITGALAVAFLITFMLQFTDKGHWIGKLIIVLVIVILGTALYYVGKTDKALQSIAEAVVVEKDQIIVIAKKDNPAKTLEDVKDAAWGIQYADDVELMGKAVDQLKKNLNANLNLTAYDNYSALYPALINGEIEVMILNSSYLDLIDDLTMESEEYQFSAEIKILETLEFETEVVQQTEEEKKEEFDITEDPFIVYISGIDTYGNIGTKSRSDVNIMMVANPETRQLLLVTTPRDSYVVIPGISGNSRDKLTHAGIYGVNKSIDTINAIYDINIDYYVRVNFNSLINIVDALGGVNVYSAYSFSKGGYSYIEGYNHLNGESALTFSRERYSFADGDNQRGRNQMEVIKGIVNKCTSPAILTGFSGILKEVSDKVQTSMTTDEMYSLVKMQLDDPRGWEIYSYAASGSGDSEYCYSYTGKKLYVTKLSDSSVQKAKSLIEKIMTDEALTDADFAK